MITLELRPTDAWLGLQGEFDFDFPIEILRGQSSERAILDAPFIKKGGRWWRDVLSLEFPAIAVTPKIVTAVQGNQLTGIAFHRTGVRDPKGNEYFAVSVSGRYPAVEWPEGWPRWDVLGVIEPEAPGTAHLNGNAAFPLDDFCLVEGTAGVVLCSQRAYEALRTAKITGVLFDSLLVRCR